MTPPRRTSKPSATSARTGNHRLVAQAIKSFRGARVDRGGILVAQERPHLAIKVGQAAFDRACTIWDAILRELDVAGHPVTVASEGTFVRIGQETLSVALRERRVRSDHVPKPAEPWSPRYDFHPTGQLVFAIEKAYLAGIPTQWSDGGRARLEEIIGTIVAGLVATAEGVRARREEMQRLEQEAAERRQRDFAERQHVDELLRQVVAWQRAQAIRKFAEAMTQSRDLGELDPSSAWSAWALAVANRMDPTLASRQ